MDRPMVEGYMATEKKEKITDRIEKILPYMPPP
jgi:hypothetical protein